MSDHAVSGTELTMWIEESSRDAEAIYSNALNTWVEREIDDQTLADPWTWAWVIQMLGEGAIQWVGAQIMQGLFGRKKAPSVAQLLQEFARLAGAILRQALDERDLRVLSADMQDVQAALREYHNAPSGLDRLQFATDRCRNSVFQLREMGLKAHPPFVVAAGIYVAILQERSRVVSTMERTNIVEFLNDIAIPHAEAMHIAWREWHDTRYKYHCRTVIHAPRMSETEFSHTVCHAFRDGAALARFRRDSPGQAQELAIQAMTRDRETLWNEVVYPTHVAPSEAGVSQWRTVAEQASQL